MLMLQIQIKKQFILPASMLIIFGIPFLSIDGENKVIIERFIWDKSIQIFQWIEIFCESHFLGKTCEMNQWWISYESDFYSLKNAINRCHFVILLTFRHFH